MSEQELQQAFIQFLAYKSGAKDQKQLEQYIQSLGEDGLKQAYNEFQQMMQQQTQKAAHGAKLNYFKKLKNKCAEDEELVYYKKGGSVNCGCVKKEQKGGKTEPKKQSATTKFKNDYSSKRVRDSEEAYFNGTADHTVDAPDPKKRKTFKNDYSTKRVKAAEKNYFNGTADHLKPGVKKNCGGSKMKLIKKGNKVCPKCGKVHSAGVGCSMKFKMHMQGGILNKLFN